MTERLDAFTALALQLTCRAVNQSRDRTEARSRMQQTIRQLDQHIAAGIGFIGKDCRLVVLPEFLLTGFPMKTFPLVAFSERVYRLRLGDETALAESVFPEELRCLGRHKMVLSRQGADGEGNPVAHWYFRHDKIMEFFIVQTFLGRDNPRAIDHIDDPRFRGVYFLLVNLMPLEAAMGLREELIQYAADTKDHTVSDTVVQLLRERSQAHVRPLLDQYCSVKDSELKTFTKDRPVGTRQCRAPTREINSRF